MALVGIVSDTHENVRIIVKAVRVLIERAPTVVIHCGDIISPPVLERFSGLPMRFVYGNNDGERPGLKKRCLELGFDEIQDTLTFDIEGKSFFVNHGTNPQVIEDAASSQRYDYVLHGHTHKMRDQPVGKTRIINPGALFAAPIFSVAFLEPGSGKLEFVELPE